MPGLTSASDALANRVKWKVARLIAISAKKLLPASVVNQFRALRTYTSPEWLVYIRLQLGNLTKFGRARRPPNLAQARSFVFVCFGNIMRSPVAEAMMKRLVISTTLPPLRITSAGLNATPGRAAHPWAIMAAHESDLSLDDHRARLVTAELVDDADVIFVMDYQNMVQLLTRWKKANGKVFMLSAFAKPALRQGAEIRDPYYLGLEETRSCYRLLAGCIEDLVTALAVEKSTPHM